MPPYFATVKPEASSHIDGVTLGGPISRDKLFFFGAWEGQFQRTPQQFFYDVPPAALRAGDFSQAFNGDGSLQIIYNPFTGNPDGTGREPFPGNRIPAALLSPIAQKSRPCIPTSTSRPPAPPTGTSGACRFTATSCASRIAGSTGTTTTSRSTTTTRPRTRCGASIADGGRRNLAAAVPGVHGALTGETTVQQYTFGETWTINSTTVFDARLGISRMTQTAEESDIALGNFGREVLGIPGMNGGTNFGDDRRYGGIPAFLMRCPSGPMVRFQCGCWCGFSTIGNFNGWDPVERDERTYSVASNMTKLKGAHELRVGYQVNKLRMDHWQPAGLGPRGFMQAATNATALNGAEQDPNIYNAYASLLLGLMDIAGTSVQYKLMTTREWQHNMYARDRWQMNNKLTLDLGLRYGYYPLVTRATGASSACSAQTIWRPHAGWRRTPAHSRLICGLPSPHRPARR